MKSLNINKHLSKNQTAKTELYLDNKERKTPQGFHKFFSGEVDLTTTISPKDIMDAWTQFIEKTSQEWTRFVNGADDIDTSIISPATLESWRRSRENKLNPLGEPQNIILTDHALQQLFDDNKLLIDISQPFLTKLFQSMKTTSFTVTLFDRNGYILQVIQDARYVDINKQYKWYPGVLWTEECGGNSSIGSVLKRKKPLQIIGAQHYLQWAHIIAASGAPIIEPEGELIGGIAIVSLLFGAHPHTLGMAISAAQAIENEIRVQNAYSLQQAIITSIPEALIAINVEGRITAINKRTQKLFGLEDQDVTRQLLRDIYKHEGNLPFLNMIDRQKPLIDVEVRIYSPKGFADYTLTCNSIFSSGGSVIGKILIFSEIQRIKSLVNKFVGAKANLNFTDIHGQNSMFKNVLEEARVISKSASNVLLLGESGTGKDIIAQAIHNASPRKDNPYVAINCAAIPRDLIASELFGYTEGAFTGSRRGGNQGKFELADGGTIFLDEIAETPLEIQAALLRVIEDKCVIRIGGSQVRTVDVRIISASNKDLIEEVNKGNFRKDLYYRLNVFNIYLPPLRERPDDIPLLVDVFIKKYASALGKTIRHVDEKVWDIFLQHSWPGNVRELQNVVERMVNYASSGRLTYDLIPPEIIDTRRTRHRKLDLESPEETERKLISHMLTLKFSKNKIAEELNVSRATLFRKMKKYGFTRKKPTP
jgi:sigma-54 dependent transcriptional regulator, acetoin dehydrogenase operon transcriptional activator AcoR